jgi:hypothetical protein
MWGFLMGGTRRAGKLAVTSKRHHCPNRWLVPPLATVHPISIVPRLDLTSCEGCGGRVRVLACLEDPLVIGKILAHLETQQAVLVGEGRRPEVRGPPPGTLTLG